MRPLWHPWDLSRGFADFDCEFGKFPRHPATPAQSKLRLEYLIDREFIERDLNDNQRYNYLA
jgi:hypothetical protein